MICEWEKTALVSISDISIIFSLPRWLLLILCRRWFKGNGPHLLHDADWKWNSFFSTLSFARLGFFFFRAGLKKPDSRLFQGQTPKPSQPSCTASNQPCDWSLQRKNWLTHPHVPPQSRPPPSLVFVQVCQWKRTPPHLSAWCVGVHVLTFKSVCVCFSLNCTVSRG